MRSLTTIRRTSRSKRITGRKRRTSIQRIGRRWPKLAGLARRGQRAQREWARQERPGRLGRSVLREPRARMALLVPRARPVLLEPLVGKARRVLQVEWVRPAQRVPQARRLLQVQLDRQEQRVHKGRMGTLALRELLARLARQVRRAR